MTLSRANTILVIVIIVINGFVITLPVWPAVSFWVRKNATNTEERLRTELQNTAPAPRATLTANRLIIPAMLFNETVHEGTSVRTLNNGLWRRPASSTPDREGNIVIAAHRFTYTNPQGVFYHLDTLKPGDELGLQWKGVTHRYKVISTKTVAADDTTVEAPTDTPRLTLYTCTPLWNPTQRLVVIAEPEKQ